MDTEKLRAFCLGLKGTTEGIKWEDHLCFMVGGKMYCISGLTDESNVSIKASEDDFETLQERDGIIPAPYLARNKWVAVTKRNALRPAEWQQYLTQSYELVKAKLPKKLRESIDS
ncbi:MAG: hypothetical protein EOP49_10650 [Sphingobacteriales bacterium]|nr:MAG: hypothetical protein EOP49_10650 [Sphingobacteriales bacterium]